MPFRLWLRRTAQERLLRELPLPEHSSLLLARPFLAPGSTPSQQLAKRELVRQVSQAVARLEADQEILLLRTHEGL
jgi:hypothetical protein